MGKQRGFTLVEIAMVIVIGALLLGFGISVLTAQLTNTRIKVTRNQANVIKTALVTFLATNDRLPCPAAENLPDTNTNYGVEDATPGTCLGTTNFAGASRGVVPWISLGLSDSAALDGWNRRFTYVVTTSHTNLLGGLNTQIVGRRTVPGMRGNVTIHSATAIGLGLPPPPDQNQINACSTTPGDNTCNNFAVVVIISHGANGSGAFLPGTGVRELPLPVGANELENTDTDTAFTQMAFINNTAFPGGVFDDLVLWLPPADLTIPLQESGVIPSAQGLLNDRVAKIESTLLGEIISDRLDVDGPPAASPPAVCTCGVDCNAVPTIPPNNAGCLRSARHRVPFADTVAPFGIADAGQINGTVPYFDLGLTLQDALDPWGQLIQYVTFPNVSANSVAPPAPLDHGVYSSSPDAQAYTLTSLGPDGAAGVDDIVYQRATTDLVGAMAGARVPVD